jgi:hypothetical protein
MAEANEQPALLNQRVDSSKKTRRPRNAAGSRRPSTAKSGVRRTKRPVKEQEPESADNHNNPGQEVSSEELSQANSQIPLPLPPVDERAPKADVFPDGRDRADSGETPEETVSLAVASPKLQEGAPAVVDTPKYEAVFGEGLIEVSGKGFGFLRDPKRNYTQSPQDIFVTPEVVRKHALRDGLWIKGEIRRGSRGPQLLS